MMTEQAASRPRTKRRIRRRYVLLLVLVIGGLFIGNELRRALTSEPGSAIDYAAKVNELVTGARPPTDGPDGWIALSQALGIWTTRLGQFTAQAPAGTPDDWPENVDWPVALEFITGDAEHELGRQLAHEFLASLDGSNLDAALDDIAASQHGGRLIPSTNRLIDVELRDVMHTRDLARLMQARMRLAGERGDWDVLAKSFEHGCAIARLQTHQAFLIDHLIGHAVMTLMLGELIHTIETVDLPLEATDRLAAVLEQQQLGRISLALEAERLMMLDTVQWTHTDDGRGNGRFIPNSTTAITNMGMGPVPSPHPIKNITSLAYPSKRRTTAKANEFYDRMVALSKLTPVERRPKQQEADAYFESELRWNDALLRMMMPTLGRSLQACDRTDVDVLRAETLLALERYHDVHASYPNRLEDLAPDFLVDAPVDLRTDESFDYDPGDDRQSYVLSVRGLLREQAAIDQSLAKHNDPSDDPDVPSVEVSREP